MSPEMPALRLESEVPRYFAMSSLSRAASSAFWIEALGLAESTSILGISRLTWVRGPVFVEWGMGFGVRGWGSAGGAAVPNMLGTHQSRGWQYNQGVGRVIQSRGGQSDSSHRGVVCFGLCWHRFAAPPLPRCLRLLQLNEILFVLLALAAPQADKGALHMRQPSAWPRLGDVQEGLEVGRVGKEGARGDMGTADLVDRGGRGGDSAPDTHRALQTGQEEMRQWRGQQRGKKILGPLRRGGLPSVGGRGHRGAKGDGLETGDSHHLWLPPRGQAEGITRGIAHDVVPPLHPTLVSTGSGEGSRTKIQDIKGGRSIFLLGGGHGEGGVEGRGWAQDDAQRAWDAC